MLATVAQAGGGDLAYTAEDRLHGEIAGGVAGSPVAASLDPLFEPAQALATSLEHLRSGAEGAECEQRDRLRLGRRQLGEGAHGSRQASLGRSLDVVGAEHDRRGSSGDVLVGAEEQLFLVGVEAVERRRGDVGEL